LEDIKSAVDFARLLALAEPRAGPRPGEKAADAGAAGADAFAQRPLRHQIELDLAGTKGFLEDMRIGRAGIGADDLADTPSADEAGKAVLARPGIVGDDDKI